MADPTRNACVAPAGKLAAKIAGSIIFGSAATAVIGPATWSARSFM